MTLHRKSDNDRGQVPPLLIRDPWTHWRESVGRSDHTPVPTLSLVVTVDVPVERNEE